MKSWLQLAEQHNTEAQVKIALLEIVSMHERLGRLGEADEYQERLKCLGDCDLDLTGSQSSSVATTENFPDINIEDLNISDALSAAKTARPSRVNSRFVKKVNAHGDSKLHTAVQGDSNAAEVISIPDQGHPLEVTDNNGWTPLGDAVSHRFLEYVKILLSYGANINDANNEGETPFLTACSHGWLEGVE